MRMPLKKKSFVSSAGKRRRAITLNVGARWILKGHRKGKNRWKRTDNQKVGDNNQSEGDARKQKEKFE